MPIELHSSCDPLQDLPFSHDDSSHHTLETTLQSCLSAHHKLSNPAPSSAHAKPPEIWSSETSLSPARQASAAPLKAPTTPLQPRCQHVDVPILLATMLVVWILEPTYWNTSIAFPKYCASPKRHLSRNSFDAKPSRGKTECSPSGEVLLLKMTALKALKGFEKHVMPTQWLHDFSTSIRICMYIQLPSCSHSQITQSY